MIDWILANRTIIEIQEKESREFLTRLNVYGRAVNASLRLDAVKREKYRKPDGNSIQKNSYNDDPQNIFRFGKLRKAYGSLKMIISREGYFERKIYSVLKKWKENHPITAIVICTVLGAILLNIIAGIILEAFIRFYWN